MSFNEKRLKICHGWLNSQMVDIIFNQFIIEYNINFVQTRFQWDSCCYILSFYVVSWWPMLLFRLFFFWKLYCLCVWLTASDYHFVCSNHSHLVYLMFYEIVLSFSTSMYLLYIVNHCMKTPWNLDKLFRRIICRRFVGILRS